LVESDVKFIIRSQKPLSRVIDDLRVTYSCDDLENYWDLYQDEDVLIMPRKFGGLCLPLNEAMSLGMVPLMTDIEPQSEFLHKQSRIKPVSSSLLMERKIGTELQRIELYSISPEELAQRIDRLAKQDLTDLSRHSDWYASKIDWKVMRKKYLREFEKLCKL